MGTKKSKTEKALDDTFDNIEERLEGKTPYQIKRMAVEAAHKVAKAMDQDKKAEPKPKTTRKKKEETQTMTLEEFTDQFKMECSFTEAVKGIKDELKRLYPEELFICFAAEHEKPGSQNGVICFHEFGDQGLVDDLGWTTMQHDMRAMQFIQNSYLNYIMRQNPDNLSEELNRIRDSVLVYASVKGLDISGFKFANKIQYMLGQSINRGDVEEVITLLEKEIDRVKKMRDPVTLITKLNAEIKRLRKAGDLAGVAKKTIELNTILDEEKKRKETEIRKAENLAKKRAAARKATAAWVEKCRRVREEKEEAARKAEQAELDRQRGRQQFQPGKAAKKKQQQIRERQTERAARKKKGKEQDDFRIVRNACSLGHG